MKKFFPILGVLGQFGAFKMEIQKNGGGVQINALGEVPHQIWAM